MLIFDQLKKNDPQLRLLALVLLGGLFVLLAGLWWVQVVSAKDYQAHLETQSFRTVRIPAVRGKILDRNGQVLAESRPSYSISLYLEDLSGLFQKEYKQLRPVKTIPAPFWKAWLGFNSVETQYVRLKEEQVQALTWQARYNVASNVVRQLATRLQQPLALDFTNFCRHYQARLALPYPVLNNLDPAQIARFEEQFSGALGADLAMQPTRVYPHSTTAAHVLGYVQRDDSSKEGEDAYDFNYYLPDYRGQVGVEAGFDAQLRGRPGAKSVLVNNLGYRQTENVWDAVEPGRNVVLTIDLRIQQAAEQALRRVMPRVRGAVVVMNVTNGDVLAMVSEPSFDPGKFIPQISQQDYDQLADPFMRPQINRATQENYAPGSIFKAVVGLAALENGLNPNELYDVQPNPARPGKGCIYVGARKIEDTVEPGRYNFKRAVVQSSNSYFIFNGLRTGIPRIVQLAGKFHFGERTGLPTRQEVAGIFPTLARVTKSNWHDGDSANICFGQGEMAVTPIQVAVAYSAMANGGTIFWPRLVERIEPQGPASGEAATHLPSGLVRDEIGVQPRSLKILRDAMLGETEDAEGTGRAAMVPGLRICGKTGTAQVKNERGQLVSWNYWFASFAPYESPRYAVVVMVQSEGRGSGGGTCAPVARDIYAAIQKIEGASGAKTLAETK
jgi:penicillin-binding protein 2